MTPYVARWLRQDQTQPMTEWHRGTALGRTVCGRHIGFIDREVKLLTQQWPTCKQCTMKETTQ